MPVKPRPPVNPTAAQPAATEERRGSAGPRAIAEMVERLTRRPLGRRGFAEASLVAQWPTIVGSALGNASLPLKIAFPPGERAGGTLHVRVGSGALAMQLAHQEPLVLERINRHFGYAAVTRLAIRQGEVARRQPRRTVPPPQVDSAAEAALQARLSGIDDPQLKAALEGLGRHLAGRKKA